MGSSSRLCIYINYFHDQNTYNIKHKNSKFKNVFMYMCTTRVHTLSLSQVSSDHLSFTTHYLINFAIVVLKVIIAIATVLVAIIVIPCIVNLIITILLTNYYIIVPIAAVVHVPNFLMIKFNLHQNWAAELYQVVAIYHDNQLLLILSNLHR